MADTTITLRLVGDNGQFVGVVRASSAELGRLGRSGQGAGDRIAQGMGGATSATNVMSNAILRAHKYVLGLFAVRAVTGWVSEISRMADTWSDLTSRVRLAIPPTENAADVMNRLAKVADSTYSSLTDTADAFARNAVTLGALGKTTQEQLDFTEALNDLLVVSGAKGDQFRQVQDSISKAMATGALRGIEFNTVMQRGIAVAQAIADTLGVNINELRGLAEQGRITGEVIDRSLRGNLDRARASADAMPATISDGFTRLRNALLRTVGVFDQANGISGNFAKGIVVLSEHMGTLVALVGGALLTVTLRFTASLVQQGVAAATAAAENFAYQLTLARMAGVSAVAATGTLALSGALRVLKLAIATTGIGLLVVVLGELVAHFMKSSTTSDAVRAGLQGLGAEASTAAASVDKLAQATEKSTTNAIKQLAALHLQTALMRDGRSAQEAQTRARLMQEGVPQEIIDAIVQAQAVLDGLTQAQLRAVQASRARGAELKREAKAQADLVKQAHELVQATVDGGSQLAKLQHNLDLLTRAKLPVQDVQRFAQAWLDSITPVDQAAQAVREYEDRVQALMVLLDQGLIDDAAFQRTNDALKAQMNAVLHGQKDVQKQAEDTAAQWSALRDTVVATGQDWARSFDAVLVGLQNVQKGQKTATLGYAQMAQGAAGFFGKQTAAYKLLQATSQAFYAFEIAQRAASMAQALFTNGAMQASDAARAETAGAAAVAEQASAGPFVGFAMAAAMLAFLASIGISAKGKGGGGTGAGSPAMPDFRTGTGTVMGDPAKQSESIQNSIDLLVKLQSTGLDVARAQLTALQQLARGISTTADLLARNQFLTGSVTGQQIGGLGTSGLGANGLAVLAGGLTLPTQVLGGAVQQIGKLLPGMLGDLVSSIGGLAGKILGGIAGAIYSVKQSVSDSGLIIQAGQSLAQVMTDGIAASFFTEIRTRKGGIFGHKTSYADVLDPLTADLQRSFDAIVTSMGNVVLTAVEHLGQSRDQALARLAQITTDDLGLGKISLKDLKGDELEKAIDAIFSTLSDALVQTVLPSVTQFQQVGEGALETLTRLVAQVDVLHAATDALGMAVTTPGQIAIADALAGAAGGVQQFAENVAGFLDVVLTPQEKLDRTRDLLQQMFANLGAALPTTAAGLRQLVSGLDLTTTAGQNAFSQITAASQSLGTYYQQLADAEKARADFTADLHDRIDELTLSADDLKRTQLEKTIQGWYDKAREVGADTTLVDRLAELERASLNAAGGVSQLVTSLQGQITQVQRQIATAGLTGGALSTAQAVFALQDNMAAAVDDAEAQQLAQQLFALQVQLAATQDAAQAATAAQQAYQQAVTDAEQALSAARQAVVDAYTREADALHATIDAAQDAAQALATARQAVSDAIDAQVSALQKVVDAASDAANRLSAAQQALKQAYDAEAAPLQQTIDRFGQLGKTLRDFSAGLGRTASDTTALTARFSTLASRARLGDADAMDALPDAARAALDAARNSVSTKADLDRLTAQVQRDVLAAADTADRTVSVAQQQLDALTAQVTALGVLNDSVLSVADAVRNLLQAQDALDIANAAAAQAQGQIDGLQATRNAVLGVDDSTLSVDEAVQRLSTAQQDQRVADAAATAAQAQLDRITQTVTALGLINQQQATLQQAIAAMDAANRNLAALTSGNTAATATAAQQTATNTGVISTEQQTQLLQLEVLNGLLNTVLFSEIKDVVLQLAIITAQLAQTAQANVAAINQLALAVVLLVAALNPQQQQPNLGTPVGKMVPSANGNAFLNGRPVAAFATGASFTNAIVNRPTAFPLGLMGEAGPEGILPLARTASGKLGVIAVPSGSDGALVAEVRALRAEVAQLRQEQAASQYAIAANTGRIDRRANKWDRDGLPAVREDAA